MALGKNSGQQKYAEGGSKPRTQLTDEASLISSEAPFTFGKVATVLDDFCTELRSVVAPACLPSFSLQGRPRKMQPIHSTAAELWQGSERAREILLLPTSNLGSSEGYR